MESSTYFNRVLLLSLAPLAKAYTVFETTCSAPNPQSEFMFVSAPNTRGTLSILWTSLFTIFACTWTIQHLGILKQRDEHDPETRGDFKWKLRGFSRSMYWMATTIMAPEIIMANAAGDLIESYELKKGMEEYARWDGVAWTLTHSFYAAMGGFVIRNKGWGERYFHHLSARDMYRLRHEFQIKSLPRITKEELQDKSKSDTLGKTVAIGQILWTIVQVIARAVQKLPVSPLEAAVIAFAVCAVFTYGMYWEKPQRILEPIEILDHMHYNEKNAALKEIMGQNRRWLYKQDESWLNVEELPAHHSRPSEQRQKYSWRKRYAMGRRTDRYTIAVTGIGAAVFGAVHLIAWDFGFPTRIELIWWRCASVYSTVSPPVMTLTFDAYMTVLHRDTTSSYLSQKLPFYLLVSFLAPLLCLYTVARLFILVEMFRTLFFLPAGSYISTWSTNIPHVG